MRPCGAGFYYCVYACGRDESFNESRVICMDREGIELRQKQQWVGGQYGYVALLTAFFLCLNNSLPVFICCPNSGVDDAETHEYTAVNGGKHNYGGYGGGAKSGDNDKGVRKRRKELSASLGLKPPPEEGAKSKVMSRAEQLETVGCFRGFVTLRE